LITLLKRKWREKVVGGCCQYYPRGGIGDWRFYWIAPGRKKALHGLVLPGGTLFRADKILLCRLQDIFNHLSLPLLSLFSVTLPLQSCRCLI